MRKLFSDPIMLVVACIILGIMLAKHLHNAQRAENWCESIHVTHDVYTCGKCDECIEMIAERDAFNEQVRKARGY